MNKEQVNVGENVYSSLVEELSSIDSSQGNLRSRSNNFMRKAIFRCLRIAAKNPKDYFLFWGAIRRSAEIFGPGAGKYLQKIEKHYVDSLETERSHIFVDEYVTADAASAFVQLVEQTNPDIYEPYEIEDNTRFLCELLELDEDEMLLVQFAFYITNCSMLHEGFRGLYGSLGEKFGPRRQVYGLFFNIDDDRMRRIFDGKTGLFKTGILEMNSDKYYFEDYFYLHNTIDELLCLPELSHDIIEKYLFPSALTTDLDREDFAFKEDEIVILEKIINKAIDKKKKGVNALLWGDPGTGKTEICMLLAKENNWDIRVIGDVDEAKDKEQSRSERLFSLKIAQKLFAKADSKRIVLLFDEMEDLFKKEDHHAAFSKAYINRIIEKTSVPILWTANYLNNIGSPAALRRMKYAIQFKVPPYDTRRHIWEKYIEKAGIHLDEKVIDDLAVDFDIVPALIRNAVDVVSMSGVDEKDIPKVISNLDTAMHLGEDRKLDRQNEGEYLFDPTLSNADLDLEELENQILATGNINFSMCLYGPPGTGKSAFARHLAEKLRMRVMFKRASDLLSMWVGESEKNIAEMFTNSKNSNRFLIMDEADSLLGDRTNAIRSWEVTQVNEMLTHMEFHPTPFVATTNLMENLDSASLRRFTFKVKFDFLRPDQIPLIFKFYFGQELPFIDQSADLLTPGDFANVKKKIGFMNITDPEKIFEMLMEECKFKPEYGGATAGFSIGSRRANPTYGFKEPQNTLNNNREMLKKRNDDE